MLVVTPSWKLRRWRYVMNHFNGSYEAMRSSARYDSDKGHYILALPKHVLDQISNDPLCQPPAPKKPLLGRLLQFSLDAVKRIA